MAPRNITSRTLACYSLLCVCCSAPVVAVFRVLRIVLHTLAQAELQGCLLVGAIFPEACSRGRGGGGGAGKVSAL